MKIAAILLILSAIMVLRGFAFDNARYIICGLFIGGIGALIFMLGSKNDNDKNKGDNGKSLRDNRTWSE